MKRSQNDQRGAGDRSGDGMENMTIHGMWRDMTPCKHGHYQWHGGNTVLCGQCGDEHLRPGGTWLQLVAMATDIYGEES